MVNADRAFRETMLRALRRALLRKAYLTNTSTADLVSMTIAGLIFGVPLALVILLVLELILGIDVPVPSDAGLWGLGILTLVAATTIGIYRDVVREHREIDKRSSDVVLADIVYHRCRAGDLTPAEWDRVRELAHVER